MFKNSKSRKHGSVGWISLSDHIHEHKLSHTDAMNNHRCAAAKAANDIRLSNRALQHMLREQQLEDEWQSFIVELLSCQQFGLIFLHNEEKSKAAESNLCKSSVWSSEKLSLNNNTTDWWHVCCT